jgi:hypothetical protein
MALTGDRPAENISREPDRTPGVELSRHLET